MGDLQLRKQIEPDKKVRIEPGVKINPGLFKVVTLTLTCRECGNQWEEEYGPLSYLKFLILGTRCPNCHKRNYRYEAVGTLLSIAIGLSFMTLGLGMYC